MQSKLFESILKEAKDFKFKAKVGDFWLQKDSKGWRLCDDKAEADEFESETEPNQIANQLKKDGFIDKKEKIEIIRERKVYPKKQRNNHMTLEEFDDWLTTEGWDLIDNNKYRSAYQNYYNSKFTLYTNFPGFDGNKYQMYLFKEPYNPEYQHYKVFDENTPNLIAIYEALADGFSYIELKQDLADIKNLIR